LFNPLHIPISDLGFLVARFTAGISRARGTRPAATSVSGTIGVITIIKIEKYSATSSDGYLGFRGEQRQIDSIR
jgi:hypothetical protein